MKTALAIVLLAGCGRIDFDPLGGVAGGDAGGDGGAPTDGPAAVSCGGLPSTCGAMGTDSCCNSPMVPGGSFARSYDVSGDGMYPDSSYGATVSDFRLDKYKVTVGRFRQFVTAGLGTQANPPIAGAGAHPNIAGSGWDVSWNAKLLADTPSLLAMLGCDATFATWTAAPGPNENRPIDCVDWYEAMAFCAWDGGFLPSEAEWNYAAAGGSEQRAYPWSSPPMSLAIDGSYASYSSDGTQSGCTGDGTPGCTLTDIIDVGTKPAGDGKWTQSDLGGNMFEWTLDWSAAPYLQNPCVDCANLTASGFRVLRGGYYDDAASGLRSASRIYFLVGTPDNRNGQNGLRCARGI